MQSGMRFRLHNPTSLLSMVKSKIQLLKSKVRMAQVHFTIQAQRP